MYISLHNQTHYSILDALSSPEELLDKAVSLGMTSIAITDHGTFASVWEAFKLSKKKKIKLIVGCEYFFKRDPNQTHFNHVILLAKNAEGYRNMLSLNFDAFANSPIGSKKKYPIVSWELLEKYSAGTICLTACGAGILAESIMENKPDQLEGDLTRLINIFGKDNLGIEIQANNLKRYAGHILKEIDQNLINRQLIKLADKHELRIVPSCNSHYINKEDHDVHDTQLAIGSSQPKSSRFRLKYDLPEFYLKSEEEIKKFFSRNFGKEFADKIVDNTNYFADLCEVPEWIDPRFSNPSGKEMPSFPARDQEDYLEFKEWVKSDNNVFDMSKTRLLEEDVQYLRYRVFLGLKAKNLDMNEKYLERVKEELEVLEMKDFSSYMLVVMDFIEYAKKNDITIGPGRGCVTSDTLVQTSVGFKKINDILVGDKVISHTGKEREVLNTFKFDSKKKNLLRIKSEKSFGDLVMTEDHKVFAMKRSYKENIVYRKYNGKNRKFKELSPSIIDPVWIEAKDLEPGDSIYTTFLNTDNKDYKYSFDLAPGTIDSTFESRSSLKDTFSVKQISKTQNFNYENVRKLRLCKNIPEAAKNKIESYLNDNNINLSDWQNNQNKCQVQRVIEITDEFLYVLGRWVGDGSQRYQQKNGISFAFNSDDIKGIERISDFFTKMGINVSKTTAKNIKSTILTICIDKFSILFKEIFPDYKNTSQSKHLPIFFRKLSKRQLASLLTGLQDSDGCITKDGRYESIKSVSERLILEIKEITNILGYTSSISVELAKINVDKKGVSRNCQKSHCIRFSGNLVPKIDNQYNNGYYAKILEISSEKSDHVYDITVDEDHSYLTTNGVIHNSVGGCLVAYLIGIHQADSIEYEMIFGRFLTKEKKGNVDIDMDIASRGRDQVKEYLFNKYGKDNSAQVSNFGTITPKVYARDIARVYELGGSKESGVTIGMSIADSIDKDDKKLENIESGLFDEYCKKYPEIKQNSKIANKYRNLSTHAAGCVCGKRPLKGLVPLRLDKDNQVCLELDKDSAEESGLVKMDLLGLKTLDIIDLALLLINKSGKQVSFPPPLDDKKAYEIISIGDTGCIFQLGGSGGTTDLCKKLKPENIDDISAINSLARPALKEYRDPFIKARHGITEFKLENPALKRAFGKTYGFGLYEECLFFIAYYIAVLDPDQADRLRKMTKDKGKYPEKVAQIRLEFIQAAVDKGFDSKFVTHIWDDVISAFQGYGFNLSHSILYSMISYQTAYLKAHFPIEFLLANLMKESEGAKQDRDSNILEIKNELRAKGIKVLPPNLNKSQMEFTLLDDQSIITGFNSLKSVGDDAITDIIAKRPFQSFQDFMIRVDSKKVRANTIQALAASGVFSEFGLTRKQICGHVSDYRKKLTTWLKKHDPNKESFIYPWKDNSEWNATEIYALETKFMGESFSVGNKIAYKELAKIPHSNIRQVDSAENKTKIGSMAGIFSKVFEITIKKEGKLQGKKMYKFNFEDFNGQNCSITVFPDGAEKMFKWIKAKTKKSEIPETFGMVFASNVNYYNEQFGLVLSDIYSLELPPNLPEDFKIKKDVKASEITTQSLSEIEEELFDEGIVLH